MFFQCSKYSFELLLRNCYNKNVIEYFYYKQYSDLSTNKNWLPRNVRVQSGVNFKSINRPIASSAMHSFPDNDLLNTCKMQLYIFHFIFVCILFYYRLLFRIKKRFCFQSFYSLMKGVKPWKVLLLERETL